MKTLIINGQEYKIVGSFEISVKGDVRTSIKLQKPKGKKTFNVVKYSNGVFSSVV